MKVLINLLCAIILCSITPLCWAASGCDGAGNCYVRAGALGAANGTDWTNAYTALPSSLTRGVTYYVAAGSYPNHVFQDADSGSTLITIQAPTSAVHGTNTGWSSAYQGQAVFSCTSGCGSVLQFATDYYVFSGSYCTPLTGASVCTSGYGFKVNNSNAYAGADIQGGLGYNGPPDYDHDITVQYVEVNGAHPTSDSSTLDTQLDFEGGSYNLLFDHLYVHDGWVPFFLKGSHANQNGGGYVFGSGNNITIQYSYVAHNYSSSAYHSEGCSCSEGLTDFTIRYNYWVDMIGTAYLATPSGADYNNGNGPNGPWYIYGNVFMATAAGISSLHCGTGDGMLTIFDANFTGDVYFVNNTIANMYGCQADNNGISVGLGFTTPMKNLIVENNLWWRDDVVNIIHTGTTRYSGASLTSTTWAYNGYFQIPDGSASNDTSTTKQVASRNPFVAYSTADYQLTSNTTTGTNTNSVLAGNSADMEGVTRDANGTWDRGALQLIGYTLTVTNGGNGTVTGTGGTANINCGSVCTETENSGTAVTLMATPNSGYTFAGWSGACSGTGTCSVPFTANAGVTATFITDKAPGQITCPSTPVTYTATPSALCTANSGAPITYKVVTGAARIAASSGGQELTLSTITGTVNITSATVPATANYTAVTVTPAAPVSFTTQPIPVNLIGCQFTLTSTTTSPVTVTTSTDMPSAAFYGDTVTISGCTTDNPNIPRLTYAFATTGLKSTLVSEKVTFKATETVAVKITAPGGRGYAALFWTSATTTVNLRPISVEANSPQWTYSKLPTFPEEIKLALTAESAPLAFSTDRLPASGGYTLTDSSNNDVTGTAENALLIGSYAITPSPAKMQASGKLSYYSITPVTSMLTVTPNNSSSALKPGVSILSIPSTKIGLSKTATVTVTNKTGELLQIAASLPVGTPFSVGVAPACASTSGLLPGGGTCTLTVTFAPTAVGKAGPTTLTITAVDANNDQFANPTQYPFTVVPVTLFSYGIK